MIAFCLHEMTSQTSEILAPSSGGKKCDFVDLASNKSHVCLGTMFVIFDSVRFWQPWQRNLRSFAVNYGGKLYHVTMYTRFANSSFGNTHEANEVTTSKHGSSCYCYSNHLIRGENP